ncbi:MAG: hypothetical protein NHB32_07045 [Fischerella sp. CENA71]|nr:hypothetical protein [Fischerella sp. CENA71]
MQYSQEANFPEADSHCTDSVSDDHKLLVMQWVDRLKSTNDLLKVVSDLEKMPLEFRREVLEIVVETYIPHIPNLSQ